MIHRGIPAAEDLPLLSEPVEHAVVVPHAHAVSRRVDRFPMKRAHAEERAPKASSCDFLDARTKLRDRYFLAMRIEFPNGCPFVEP